MSPGHFGEILYFCVSDASCASNSAQVLALYIAAHSSRCDSLSFAVALLIQDKDNTERVNLSVYFLTHEILKRHG